MWCEQDLTSWNCQILCCVSGWSHAVIHRARGGRYSDYRMFATYISLDDAPRIGEAYVSVGSIQVKTLLQILLCIPINLKRKNLGEHMQWKVNLSENVICRDILMWLISRSDKMFQTGVDLEVWVCRDMNAGFASVIDIVSLLLGCIELYMAWVIEKHSSTAVSLF